MTRLEKVTRNNIMSREEIEEMIYFECPDEMKPVKKQDF